MNGIDDRVRALVQAASAACDRGDWSSAMAIVDAAGALAPDDPGVLALRDRAEQRTSAAGTRRRLTVIFCDLVGSTDLASVLDPEDMRDLLHAYYDNCAKIAHQHDGHVARLVGDGVLIYFGYPRAHEDDAIRAVQTGLAIVEAVGSLRSPTTDATGAVTVRIGIHTGLAVVAELGSGAWASPDELVGETPNLAARVQSAAPAGEVVITADTLLLVRDRVVVQSIGTHPLKGIPRPIELFRVASLAPEDADTGRRLEEAITVNRDAERATLTRAWEQVAEEARYVVISGEPGIGKSHLVRHAQELARDDGTCVVLRCSALHANRPLYPIARHLLAPSANGHGERDQLEQLEGVAEKAGLAGDESVHLLAMMCSVPWPEHRPVPALQPERARERTLALICAWFEALARERRLLLVLEDLHWADPSTRDLLELLVGELQRRSMLVLVTTRLEPETAPGTPTDRLALQPLNPVETTALIDRLTSARLDERTRTAIAIRGEGVPLYVRELATMLDMARESGMDLAANSVPPTLNDLLVARLDAVPQAREVVEAMAVLAQPAPANLVAHVAGVTDSRVQQQLEHLDAAGILRYSPSTGQYDFRHALLRDAAYDVQLRASRRGLHRRAANALQTVFTWSHENHPQELAHHYQLAGESTLAVTLWIQAGFQQAALAAHQEAIHSFESALRELPRLEEDSDELELRARSGLAASLLALRGYTAPEVESAYARVRELSASRSGTLEMSGLYGLWAYYHVTGDASASLETAQTLQARATASDDPQAELAAKAVLGYQLQRLGQPAKALPLLSHARRWTAEEPLFPHHAGIGAEINLAMTHWLLGEFAAARASVAASVAAADALEGPTGHFTRAYVHAFAAELFQVAGQPDNAAVHAARAVQISDEFGFASWLGAAMTNLKIAEALAGDAAATTTIEYCVGAWRSAGASANLTQFELGLALAYRAGGRTADALGAVERAVEHAAQSRELYLEPELHRVRGELLTEVDPDEEEGRAELERALRTAVTTGARALELRALLSLERSRRGNRDPSRRGVIELLLRRLDPTGQDPEPLLAEARALIDPATCP